jgi:hypothetical protein
MTDLISTIRTAVRKRAAYQLTVAELENMTYEVAIDLDLDPTEARKNAHRAVYGY